ncbi:MAG TPA: cadherin-like domain-containing protein, partial [Candidatus Eisenbacteria bacterium]|nr:cadherin-like domain-containing protein [Candidatus Eisenbacteria bacterium]
MKKASGFSLGAALVVTTALFALSPLAHSAGVPPTAANDSYFVEEGGTLIISAQQGVLANDTDPDTAHNLLRAIQLSDTIRGTLTLNADGSFVYVHNGSEPTSDRFTYKANDGSLDSVLATVSITIIPVDDPPTFTTVGGLGLTQYSDPVDPVTIIASDVDSPTLSPSISRWRKAGDAFTAGAPPNLRLTPLGGNMWKLEGNAFLAVGSYDLEVTVSDGSASVAKIITITIDAENATIQYDSANPVAVRVAASGGNASFDLKVNVTETFPEHFGGSGALPGDISKAEVTMVLLPVGPGSPITGTCTKGAVVGAGYGATLPVTCRFANVPVNAYTISTRVIGGYYTSGQNAVEDIITVSDPSGGFTTGGGHFLWPGTTDHTTFGFVVRASRGFALQGNLLVTRNTARGQIYRLKSDSLGSLSVGEETAVPMRWAFFTGSSTYLEPGRPAPIGNYGFACYVEDRNESG